MLARSKFTVLTIDQARIYSADQAQIYSADQAQIYSADQAQIYGAGYRPKFTVRTRPKFIVLFQKGVLLYSWIYFFYFFLSDCVAPLRSPWTFSWTWKVDVVRYIPGSFSTFPLLQPNFPKPAGEE